LFVSLLNRQSSTEIHVGGILLEVKIRHEMDVWGVAYHLRHLSQTVTVNPACHRICHSSSVNDIPCSSLQQRKFIQRSFEIPIASEDPPILDARNSIHSAFDGSIKWSKIKLLRAGQRTSALSQLADTVSALNTVIIDGSSIQESS
jgi:hypothetical protein